MKLSESQFIRERCLKVIRKASMHENSWEMTLLNRCHDPIASAFQMDDSEYPLVSFFAGTRGWTLYTTHRLVAEASGKRTEIWFSEFGSTDFGNFKQDLDSPRVTEATIHTNQGKELFLYESGYASMAPIYYFRFLSLKWPVWKETFRLENEKAELKKRNVSNPLLHVLVLFHTNEMGRVKEGHHFTLFTDALSQLTAFLFQKPSVYIRSGMTNAGRLRFYRVTSNTLPLNITI